jgi:pyrimidine operon attenuation protein/uracil phosphoribosyltransferase
MLKVEGNPGQKYLTPHYHLIYESVSVRGMLMDPKKERKIILNQKDIRQVLKMIAQQITSRYMSRGDTVLVGIRTGGAFLAFRLRDQISGKDDEKVPTGVLDINLYRDDWTRIGPNPKIGSTEIPFSIDDKIVILVDDVLFTGRTVRAAMDALMDFGRPKKIELAVLVDRGEEQRELPIKATYVAKECRAAGSDTVNVYLKEQGFRDRVVVEQKEGDRT